jgi:hypothetical protein
VPQSALGRREPAGTHKSVWRGAAGVSELANILARQEFDLQAAQQKKAATAMRAIAASQTIYREL